MEGRLGECVHPPHPHIPSGAEFLEELQKLFGNICESKPPKEKSPPTNNRHTEVHNGGCKPFSKICGDKKTTALVIACNGISPKG